MRARCRCKRRWTVRVSPALPAPCGRMTPSPCAVHIGAVHAVDVAGAGAASLLASGGEDGRVLAADLRCAARASSPHAAAPLGEGVTSLRFTADGDPVLYAATEGGALHLVDLRNPNHPLQLPVRCWWPLISLPPSSPSVTLTGVGPSQSTLAPAHALLPLPDRRVLVGADDGSLSVVDTCSR